MVYKIDDWFYCAFICVISRNVVTGQTITGGGNVTALRGDNVDIFWKLNDITSLDTFVAYFNKTIASTEIISFTVGTVTVNKTIDIKASVSETPSALVDLKSRLSVVYIYTGKFGGTDSGRILFSISNVKLEDINSYILKIGRSTDIISLTVNTRPAQTNIISSTIVDNEKVAVSWNVSGKPQPNVRCRIEQGSPVPLTPTKVSPYDSEYTGIISATLNKCEEKIVICMATGYNGASIQNHSTVKRKFSTNEPKFIENVKYLKNYITNCSTVKWDTIVENGLCGISYDIKSLNKGNVISVGNKNKYFACNLTPECVKIITSIYDTVNGKNVMVTSRTSNCTKFTLISSLTTIPATTLTSPTSATTPTTISLTKTNMFTRNNNTVASKTKGFGAEGGIIVALSMIIMLIIVLLIVLYRQGIISVNLSGNEGKANKKACKDYDLPSRRVDDDSNKPSDYMELQAARDNSTYQALTSPMQSTEITPKDNAKYEVYYNQ